MVESKFRKHGKYRQPSRKKLMKYRCNKGQNNKKTTKIRIKKFNEKL